MAAVQDVQMVAVLDVPGDVEEVVLADVLQDVLAVEVDVVIFVVVHAIVHAMVIAMETAMIRALGIASIIVRLLAEGDAIDSVQEPVGVTRCQVPRVVVHVKDIVI